MTWVDHAKGISIILVVMMHSTLGVGIAMGGTGWLHAAVEFAQPFRVPAFFVLAGLFAHRAMVWPWRRFIDGRIIHYAYFYVLWVTIQFAFKAPGIAASDGIGGAAGTYALAFVQPFGTLWFIYMLPIFYLAVRWTRILPMPVVGLVALALHLAPIATGWTVIDEFAARFIFFFVGYALYERIFDFAAAIQRRPATAIGALAAWLAIHAWAQAMFAFPGLTSVLAVFGSMAVIAVAALIAGANLPERATGWLAWCGRYSIVIYLAFFLPMAVTRVAIVKTGLITDVGLASLVTTIAALVGPVVFYWLTQATGRGRFLFERPRLATYERRATDRALVPAE